MTFKALNASAEKVKPTDRRKNQKLHKNTYFPNGTKASQNMKNRTTMLHITNYTPGYKSKQIKTVIKKDAHIPLFITTSLTTVKMRKQARCPSTDGWIEDTAHTHTHTHTMDYRSAAKKNGSLPHAATQMDLEGIVLNDLRQRKTSII